MIRFDEVPDQISLQAAADLRKPEDFAFEKLTNALAQKLGVQVEVNEVVTHDTNRAIVEYVRHMGVDIVITDVELGSGRTRLFGSDVEWLMDHVPCDSIIVKDRGLSEVNLIAIVEDKRPYEPLKVATANNIAVQENAHILFLHVLNEDTSDTQFESIKSYHKELGELCNVPTESKIIRTNKHVEPLEKLAEGADLVIVSASGHQFFHRGVFGELADRIADRMKCTVLLFHSHDSPRHTFLHNLVQRFIY